MKYRLMRAASVAPFLLGSLSTLAGCGGEPSHDGHVENIECVMHFANINNGEDRQRIYHVVSKFAKDQKVAPEAVPDQPSFDLTFVAPELKTLDDIDGGLRYVQSGGEWQQALTAHDPQFGIRYDTFGIGIKIKILVTFSADPGAKVYWKFEGGDEVELDDAISSTGSMDVAIMVPKGKDFILERAIRGGEEKFTKLDLHTQEVTIINKSEYTGVPSKK